MEAKRQFDERLPPLGKRAAVYGAYTPIDPETQSIVGGAPYAVRWECPAGGWMWSSNQWRGMHAIDCWWEEEPAAGPAREPKTRLVRIVAPRSCAGLVVRRGTVVETAPLLRKWLLGRTERQVADLCERRGWECEEVFVAGRCMELR